VAWISRTVFEEPKVVELVYLKNFLTRVVLRLDFQPVALLQTETRTPFSDEIRTRFPDVSSQQSRQIQFNVGPAGSGFEQKFAGYIWSHQKDKRSVVLSPDSLTIDYGAGEYVDDPEFLDVFEFVYASFEKNIGVGEFTRVGMRFIDEIVFDQGDPLDWDNLINPNLVASVKAGLKKDCRLTRSMHQVTMRRDDVAMIFNYGLQNPDFPNPIVRRIFALDYDAYISSAVPARDVRGRIRELQAECVSKFEESIEDGLRKIMGIKK
jgi:uncharacterized protein (TIGR04255 family)